MVSMPGKWPKPNTERNVKPQRQLLRVDTNFRESTLQVAKMDSASSNSSRDELFFDIPNTPSGGQNAEESQPSFLIFEPVVSTVTESEPTDWRRYEPPQELLKTEERTSEDIQSLLESSIARIQARHEEEEEERIATARRERPIARVGRASIKPSADVRRLHPKKRAEGLDPLTPLNEAQSRTSGGSATSVLSADSGHSSISPKATSPSNPDHGNRRIFGLSSIFRWREKPTSLLANLEPTSSPATPGEEPAPIPAANREPLDPVSTTQECVSCLDDFPLNTVVKLSCHSYCKDCFLRLISTALESETHWPAKCCLNTIPSATILLHINDKMKTKYRQRETEWAIPAGDRIYCSAQECSTWIPPNCINRKRNLAKCPKCSKGTCTICRAPSHKQTECPQDPELRETMNLAEIEGWKRCYSCHAMVEHNEGCRHMTCRCKAEFCYICGLRWRTCACTDAQLTTVQQQAQYRRQERAVQDARAAAAAEEERIILQMVADFERAEEQRLAQAAEAERRVAEARRRRLEEQLRRREEVRIAKVHGRYRRLTTQLETLHDIQRVLIAERHDFESGVMKKDLQDALDTLSLRHPHETQFLGMESKAKIEESEQKFLDEYQRRLEEELRIENEYVDQLKAYWGKHPDGEYKIREARDALRTAHEKEYKFWDSYRRKQLQAVAEGESRKREALMVRQASEIKAIEGRAKIDEAEWKKKVQGEGIWFDEVVRERIAMLQEREQQEYAQAEEI